MNKASLSEAAAWCARTLIGILTYLGFEMRSDIKLMKDKMPAMEQQINDLEKRASRLENKVYSLSHFPAKKEDELSFDNLIKMQ